MKQLGALLIAALLIGAGLLVNSALHNKSKNSPAPPPAIDRKVNVVCATEFKDACAALVDQLGTVATFTTAAPGDTAAALVTTPKPTFDLWLTSDPWPALVAVRNKAAQLGSASSPLAESELKIVTVPDGLKQLSQRCDSLTIDGKCLTRAADPQYKIGSTSTNETAGALLVSSLTQGWFDGPFDSTDVDANDDFVAAFSNTHQNTVRDPDPLRTLLTIPRFQIAVQLNVDTELKAAAAGDLYRRTPFPNRVLARAVAVPAATNVGRSALARLDRGRVVAALKKIGWQAPTSRPSNVVNAGLLDALLQRWSP